MATQFRSLDDRLGLDEEWGAQVASFDGTQV
jgi:hypothetical protein